MNTPLSMTVLGEKARRVLEAAGLKTIESACESDLTKIDGYSQELDDEVLFAFDVLQTRQNRMRRRKHGRIDASKKTETSRQSQPDETGLGWGRLLREARETRGLSLDEVADAIGITREALRQYEIGKNIPVRRLVPIAAALGVQPSDLWTFPALPVVEPEPSSRPDWMPTPR